MSARFHPTHPYRPLAQGKDKHEREAYPLHPQLRDAQQPCQAVERFQFLAAGDILAGGREEEDIGKSRSRAGRTEEDEVRRDALRSSSRDDPDMLREVAHQHTHEDYPARESVRIPERRRVSKIAGFGGTYMDTIMLMDPGLASWSHRPSINGDVIVLSMCM